MKSNLFKFALIVLTVGILSACGAQATEAPASAPTEASVPATQAPTQPPAEATVAPATEAPTTAPSGSTATVSFTNDVLPILQSRCVNCHGGDRTEEGLSLNSYTGVINGSENGAVVTPGDASNSLLAELISTQKMSKRGPKLTPPQVQVIIDWINQGALEN